MAGSPPPQGRGLDFVDGPRLVAIRLEAPGTEPVVVGIHDRATGQPCRFAEARDGALRCLPAAAGVYLTGLYADPGCGQQVASIERPPEGSAEQAPFERATPTYLTLPAAERRCGAAAWVRRLHRLAPGAPLFGRADDGRCLPQPEKGDRPLFAVGEEVAAGAFEEGAVEQTAVSPAFAVERIRSGDGGLFADRVVVRATGRRCAFDDGPYFHGGIGCASEIAHIGGHPSYADPACSGTPVLTVLGCQAPPPFVEVDRAVHPIGALFEGPRHWRAPKSDKCERQRPGDERTYTLGPALPMPPPPLPPLTRVPAGTGRLRALVVGDEAGTALTVGLPYGPGPRLFGPDGERVGARGIAPFHDAALGRPCVPVATASAGIRCVAPDWGMLDNLYANAACAGDPLVLGGRPGGEILIVSAGRARALRRIGPRHEGAVFRKDAAAGACRREAWAPEVVHELGEELPWDRYPALTLTP